MPHQRSYLLEENRERLLSNTVSKKSLSKSSKRLCAYLYILCVKSKKKKKKRKDPKHFFWSFFFLKKKKKNEWNYIMKVKTYVSEDTPTEMKPIRLVLPHHRRQHSEESKSKCRTCLAQGEQTATGNALTNMLIVRGNESQSNMEADAKSGSVAKKRYSISWLDNFSYTITKHEVNHWWNNHLFVFKNYKSAFCVIEKKQLHHVQTNFQTNSKPRKLFGQRIYQNSLAALSRFIYLCICCFVLFCF
ncbi:hypothetical protein RFI_24189, partial [Reticulomyxa filosa]